MAADSATGPVCSGDSIIGVVPPSRPLTRPFTPLSVTGRPLYAIGRTGARWPQAAASYQAASGPVEVEIRRLTTPQLGSHVMADPVTVRPAQRTPLLIEH